MRRFHNDIKRNIINKAFQLILVNEKITTIRVIDLACGRGGDLLKWQNNSIFIKYLGVDFSNELLNEAIQRNSNINNEHFDAQFKLIDLSKESLDECHQKSNIMSCQFALHYFYKSIDVWETFLKSITSNLMNDGKLNLIYL